MHTADTGLPQPSLELCLDLTDTVDWRTSDHSKDLLQNYQDLVNWSLRKGTIDDEESGRLKRLAESDAETAEQTLKQAKDLREAIYRIFSGVAHGRRANERDLAILNHFLSRAMARMEVQPTDSGYRLGWCTEELADKMLYPVAKSAAELLTSGHVDRVRECANEEEGCGSMFLDYSKSHSRRWCSMESCGNKMKLRTYYARHGRTGRQKKHAVV